jgi:hypothetical protein
MAYTPASNRWRVLRRFALSPQASSIAVAGARLLVWDYLLDAGLYDPSADHWLRLPRLPLSEAECSPASTTVRDTVIAWYCGGGALFDVRSRRWSRLESPRRGLGLEAPVSAGSRALFLGRTSGGGPPELWAYRLLAGDSLPRWTLCGRRVWSFWLSSALCLRRRPESRSAATAATSAKLRVLALLGV